MSANDGGGPPWWMDSEQGESGDKEQRTADSGGGDGSSSTSTWSWITSVGALASEWLASSGARDHSNHTEPNEHPQCIFCRVISGIGAVSSSGDDPQELPSVQWLPVNRK